MNSLKILCFFILLAFLSGCKKSIDEEYTYEFLKSYCADITVGGAVGISKKCFEIGDRINGKRVNNGFIPVRIAANSKENDKPANPSSYQEFVDVPSAYLRLTSN